MKFFYTKHFIFTVAFVSLCVVYGLFSFYQMTKEEIDAVTMASRVFLAFVFSIIAIFVYVGNSLYLQKEYYGSIIDNSDNIVIITDGEKLLEVNKIFLERFGFKDAQEFSARKNFCLTDYFVEEEGYLHIEENGMLWFYYALNYPEKRLKVKMNINEKIYYFILNTYPVKAPKKLYSIVLSDITDEENYRLELEESVLTDALTGVRNRRYFDEKIQEEILLAQRYQRPFSLVLLDLDYFKDINDKHGHDIGDKVLVWFSQTVQKEIRKPDVFCRIDGEEFAIILPEIRLNNAVRFAKKINKIVKREEGCFVEVSVSLGVVEYTRGESEKDIFKRAENALYKAKTSGKDKVVIG